MTTAIRTAGLPLLFALCVFASSGAVADSPGMRAAPVQQSSGGTSGVAPGNVSNQAPRAPMAPRAPGLQLEQQRARRGARTFRAGASFAGATAAADRQRDGKPAQAVGCRRVSGLQEWLLRASAEVAPLCLIRYVASARSAGPFQRSRRGRVGGVRGHADHQQRKRHQQVQADGAEGTVTSESHGLAVHQRLLLSIRTAPMA